MRRLKRAMLMPWTNRITYTQKVQALGPIQFLPQAEPAGAAVALDASGNGRNGAYSNVTLGQPGIGDGRTSALYVPASSSFCNIYSASLAGAFSGDEGSIIGWFRVSGAGVWTDSTTRRLAQLFVDANNRILFTRPTTNNEIDWFYIAGGTSKSSGVTSFSPTGFFHLALTWSKAADQVKFYVNGAQSGATMTGLGTWAGALSSTQTLLASVSTTPANLWDGFSADWAVFARPLTAAEVLSVATP